MHAPKKILQLDGRETEKRGGDPGEERGARGGARSLAEEPVKEKRGRADDEKSERHFLAHIPAAELREAEVEEAGEEFPALVMLGEEFLKGEVPFAEIDEIFRRGGPFVPIRQRQPEPDDDDQP